MEIFNTASIGERNQKDDQNPLINQIAFAARGDSEEGRRPPVKELDYDYSSPPPNRPTVTGTRHDNPQHGTVETDRPSEDSQSNNHGSGGSDPLAAACSRDLSRVAIALDMQFTNDQMESTKKDFKMEFSTGYFNKSVESLALSRDREVVKGATLTWEDNKDNVIVRATDSTNTMKFVATAPKAEDGQLIFSSVLTKSDGTVKKGWEVASFDRDCTLRMTADQWVMGQPKPAITTRTEIAIHNGNIAMILPGSNGYGKYSANLLPMINGTESGAIDVVRR